ncbi:MAG TPA: protein translocase subunit SecF [Vicinamibacterales bacterium]|nr:protein translocase subunit SecF [Vicinamibacterales bacterium]
MHIVHNTNFDFLRWRWQAIAVSWVIIIAGVLSIWKNGIPQGVEFAGGTVVIEKFEQAVTVQQVRAALDKTLPGAQIQLYGDPSQNQVQIRVPSTGGESGTDLSKTAKQVGAALKNAGLPKVSDPPVSTEIVGPTVGQELTNKGLLATFISLFFILLYLAFRFQFSFGVGAIVATIHDLLITLAFLAFFRYDMTLNVIAAILTMAGYSTNDTIVIFDRIRENLRSMRRDSMYNVINISVNQTLNRTIITGGTALLTSLALFFFGGEVLHGFAFTMIVGIITGTYSSVFIAAAIVSFWRGKGPARAAASAPVPPAPAQQQPQRKQKSRNARAS